MSEPAESAGAASHPAPSLGRRMACFAYEATLLFGLSLIPGVLGAIFVAQTGQRHPLQGELTLQAFALVVYGVYFVYLWSQRGQTLAMQTWRLALVTEEGERVTQARALARYGACCLSWFGVPALLASAFGLAPWPSLGLVAAWIAIYALAALAGPGRQFWHDRLCRTRLVDARGRPATGGAATPRLR